MPPLPPYRFRPLKRTEVQRSGHTAKLKETAETLSEKLTARSGRISVKPLTGIEKPQLKVLGRAC